MKLLFSILNVSLLTFSFPFLLMAQSWHMKYEIHLVQVLIILLVATVLILFLYYQRKMKYKNKKIDEQQKLLDINNTALLRMEIDLENKNKELQELKKQLYMQESLSVQNEVYQKLNGKVDKIRNEIEKLREEKLFSLPIYDRLLKLSQKVVPGSEKPLLTVDDWKNIVEGVDCVYAKFNLTFRGKGIDFTSLDLDYCYLSFFQLDLCKEAILLGINRGSVSKRRNRVRQKLGIVREEVSLYEYIISELRLG